LQVHSSLLNVVLHDQHDLRVGVQY
jgi:hypothetical protein